MLQEMATSGNDYTATNGSLSIEQAITLSP
ncbi:hypothetical protein CRC_02164 [Cylindrospermopsis raciborskii CS-505]|nr:hypothetical protein CRC_02164 [Cylindrospermopsis raciborskii CS-505]